MTGTPNDPGKHYRYEFRGVKMDPYRVAQICGLNGGPGEHMLKKLMRGARKGHSEKQLIDELQCCLDRWREMNQEDADDTINRAGIDGPCQQ